MQKVFTQAAELEKLSKEKFSIPPFLLMENAARKMADFIISKNPESVLILCGKGNNGGDGYALARMLLDKCQVLVYCQESPNTQEAQVQYQMCIKLGVKIVTDFILPEKKPSVIVDCLYGIGFHGNLEEPIKKLLDQVNQIDCLKVACDIPSGLYFKADYTITMGEEKTSLYSDPAKAVCGQIILADLGIPRNLFESTKTADAYLIEETDLKLPQRINPAAHKGTYGHTCVISGQKSGAAIIAASAALHFGSGLTSLIKTSESNLEQFKISPQLMIADSIPAKASALVIGPGFAGQSDKELRVFINWFKNTNKPALVLDAGIFSLENLCSILEELNKLDGGRIILTPHLSECQKLFSKIKESHQELELSDEEFSVKNLANSAESKIKLGKIFNQLYPNTTLVMKSANTFIASGGQTYICKDGVQSLAKGGSGDVLSGMLGSLLAQGYSCLDAAITGVEEHAIAAKKIGKEAYDLSPEKLIENI